MILTAFVIHQSQVLISVILAKEISPSIPRVCKLKPCTSLKTYDIDIVTEYRKVLISSAKSTK